MWHTAHRAAPSPSAAGHPSTSSLANPGDVWGRNPKNGTSGKSHPWLGAVSRCEHPSDSHQCPWRVTRTSPGPATRTIKFLLDHLQAAASRSHQRPAIDKTKTSTGNPFLIPKGHRKIEEMKEAVVNLQCQLTQQSQNPFWDPQWPNHSCHKKWCGWHGSRCSLTFIFLLIQVSGHQTSWKEPVPRAVCLLKTPEGHCDMRDVCATSFLHLQPESHPAFP